MLIQPLAPVWNSRTIPLASKPLNMFDRAANPFKRKSTSYSKKLHDVALSLSAINAASASERSTPHGHLSTLRLWWARRPLVASRVAVKSDMPKSGGDQDQPAQASESRLSSRGRADLRFCRFSPLRPRPHGRGWGQPGAGKLAPLHDGLVGAADCTGARPGEGGCGPGAGDVPVLQRRAGRDREHGHASARVRASASGWRSGRTRSCQEGLTE